MKPKSVVVATVLALCLVWVATAADVGLGGDGDFLGSIFKRQAVDQCVVGTERAFLGPQDFLDIMEDTDIPLNNRLEAVRQWSNDVLVKAGQFAKTNPLSSVTYDPTRGADSGDGNVVNFVVPPVLLQTERVHGPANFADLGGVEANPLTLPQSVLGRLNPLNLANQFLCNVFKYDCPYRLYVLWAFFYNNRKCVLPWPHIQLIKYAACLCQTCRAPFRSGRCRPDYYERRRVLAVCGDGSTGGQLVFHWQSIVLYIPQRCSCRTC